MQRTIHQLDTNNNVLRKIARKLSKEEIATPEIQSLIQEMKEIMHNAPGVGLAAPQIGVSIQLAVIEDNEERLKGIATEILAERGRKPVAFHVLINPEIIQSSGRMNYFFEGCLSVKGRARITPRYESVTVRFLNERGEQQEITASGWYARILQHEIGHLNGKLYIDIADARTEVETNEEFKEKWMNAPRDTLFHFYKDKCPDVECFYADKQHALKK
jgi:peptide deformylase